MDVTAYIGEIRMFAGQDAPKGGWTMCDGRIVSISEYEMLFYRIGTTYGGDGDSTFGLPDLRARVPVQVGNKSKTVPLYLGQKSGNESIQLTGEHMYPHTHTVLASMSTANSSDPKNASLAGTGGFNFFTNDPTLPTPIQPTPPPVDIVAMHPDMIAKGDDYAVPVMQHYQTINYIIAFEGI